MKGRPFKKLIPIQEALETILGSITPLEDTEKVPLEDAVGRVLAVDVTADSNVPPFRRAAMDGYAVIAEDVFSASQQAPVELDVTEDVYAGQMPEETVTKGKCARVATGAPMPEGADAVVMIEESEEKDDGKVLIFKPQYPGGDVSKAGSDIEAGQKVLAKAVVLDPAKIGVLAALGISEVEVVRRPLIGVAPTGNEVVPVGKELSPAKVYDINTHTISSVVKGNGGAVRTREIVEDTLEGLTEALNDMKTDCDMIVFSGGSSVGERDLLVDLLGKEGEVLFHGVLVKPGKPTLFGLVDNKPFFGMPGYPTSCLSNAYLFIIPALRRMLGLDAFVLRKVRATMGVRYNSTLGRHHIVTVILENGVAHPVFKESGAITSMANAQGFIEIPADQDLVDKGDEVEVILL
jgi:molybdenum cofactor synthesis domain-containing protein